MKRIDKYVEAILTWVESRLPERWRSGKRRRLVRIWLIGLAASAAVTALSQTSYFEQKERAALDLVLKLTGRRLASDVVIVAIDDQAFDGFGQRQPIPRDYLARIVRGLRASGAAVVAVDIALTAPSSDAADTALAQAIEGFKDGAKSRVVLPSILPPSGPLAPGAVGDVLTFGSPDVMEDADHTVRRAVLMFPRSGGAVEPAFAVAVAARLRAVEPRAFVSTLEVGRRERTVPINFAGPARTFLTIPSDVVAALGDGGSDVAATNPFRDRVVLVGATFADSRDFFMTPHGRLPGVEVHANIVHMLLTRSFIHPVTWLTSFVIQVTAVLVAGVIMVYARASVVNALCLVAPVLLAVPLSYLAFNSGGYWVDFALPVVTTKFLGSWVGRFERGRIRAGLAPYVSTDVSDRILAQAIALDGERRDVTVVACDLRGRTPIAEMPAETVGTQLNEYLQAVTIDVFRHGGMVNDLVGTDLVAIFGAPLDDADHAAHAVHAATDIAATVERLGAHWQARNWPKLFVGIGIHTGSVFAGNVGGGERMKYTIAGGVVTTAARVASMNSDLATTILVTDATLAQLGGLVGTRECGSLPLADGEPPVQLHEVRGPGPEPEIAFARSAS